MGRTSFSGNTIQRRGGRLPISVTVRSMTSRQRQAVFLHGLEGSSDPGGELVEEPHKLLRPPLCGQGRDMADIACAG